MSNVTPHLQLNKFVGNLAILNDAGRHAANDANLDLIDAAVGAGVGAKTIASGTQALGTTLIASGAASAVISTAVAGVLATDNIMADFSSDPSAVTGYAPSASGMLTIIKWCSAGNINFYQYNLTGSSITPGPITLNYRVVR